MQLESSRYGKSRVRLVKVERRPDRHDLRDLTIHILFTGDYDDCYLSGDNSRILPTDTMKNTVYALARKHPVGAIEDFGTRLCAHFLEHNPHLRTVRIDIEENLWARIDVHTFHKTGGEVRTACIENGAGIAAGVKDLILLKTTDSSFEGYIHDQYTSLKETADRILGTAVQATWRYGTTEDLDFDALWLSIRLCMIEAFTAHKSPSVQSTLYQIGAAVLRGFPDVEEISLSLPNKHCLLVDLKQFGMDNPNEVFLPVDEPHGLIEATMRRP